MRPGSVDGSREGRGGDALRCWTVLMVPMTHEAWGKPDYPFKIPDKKSSCQRTDLRKDPLKEMR